MVDVKSVSHLKPAGQELVWLCKSQQNMLKNQKQ